MNIADDDMISNNTLTPIKIRKCLQELAIKDQEIKSLRASVSEKDTLLQRKLKILSNLVEELKSDMETIQNEITTKNRERELEKSISTFLMT